MGRRDSLRRRPGRRESPPRILIVCEGEVTEPGYFRHLRHAERIQIVLEIENAGVPLSVVKRTIELLDLADQAANRTGDPNERFDHVWCVVDVDDHPILCDKLTPHRDDALKRARELELMQQRNGKPDGNPSTGVHQLVDQIQSFRRPFND